MTPFEGAVWLIKLIGWLLLFAVGLKVLDWALYGLMHLDGKVSASMKATKQTKASK